MSEAKNLASHSGCQILRSAQDDNSSAGLQRLFRRGDGRIDLRFRMGAGDEQRQQGTDVGVVGVGGTPVQAQAADGAVDRAGDPPGRAAGPQADVKESGDAEAAASLYTRLEKDVLPLYYENRSGWVSVMKGAISKNASRFNSHRMLRRYVSDAYFR